MPDPGVDVFLEDEPPNVAGSVLQRVFDFLKAGFGSDADEATQLGNGTGLLGWLSGIHHALAGPDPLVVESRPATITDAVYESGNLTSWTQDGVDYEATYDVDGNLLTQGPAA